MLNPKVALFFIAFLPQFASASRGNLALQLVFLGLLFDTSGTLVNTIVALISGTLGKRSEKQPQPGSRPEKIQGQYVRRARRGTRSRSEKG